MKQQLIFALMAGTHRHRYTDTSGRCAACHSIHSPHKYNEGVCSVCGFAGCEHPRGRTDKGNGTHVCPVCGAVNEHVWIAAPTETRCQRCNDCRAEQQHKWQDGACETCKYKCKHPSYSHELNVTQHFCDICHKVFPHNFEFLHDKTNYCQRCTKCHYSLDHDFPEKNQSGCGKCSKCGDLFAEHDWTVSQVCIRCGYNCTHPYFENNVCTTCGFQFYDPKASYYVIDRETENAKTGIYTGSYKYAGEINEQKYYRQYIKQGEKDSGSLIEGEYYLVDLKIYVPTRFGGLYAYTATGKVFVKSVSNLQINNTLLSGNGKYQVTLEQFDLDERSIAKGSYTSTDCSNLIIKDENGRW